MHEARLAGHGALAVGSPEGVLKSGLTSEPFQKARPLSHIGTKIIEAQKIEVLTANQKTGKKCKYNQPLAFKDAVMESGPETFIGAWSST